MHFETEFEIAVGDMGLRPDEFWRLTHAEFFDMYDGWARNLRRRENEIVETAWRVENFRRAGNQFPDLKTLLLDINEKPQEKREQTPEQMIAVFRMINAALGGTEVEM